MNKIEILRTPTDLLVETKAANFTDDEVNLLMKQVVAFEELVNGTKYPRINHEELYYNNFYRKVIFDILARRDLPPRQRMQFPPPIEAKKKVSRPATPAKPQPKLQPSKAEPVKADTFKVEKSVETSGELCPKGARVKVHYTGYLTDGKKFDSSVDRGTPFDFTVGVSQVIKCWDEGVTQMRKGEKAKLTCPSDYAYGERGYPGAIPPKATLIFEVELIEFKK